MDRLGMCMDELRVLARSNDPDRAVSVEGHIDTYLTAETVSVWQALERLCKGIRDEQAKGREGEDWSTQPTSLSPDGPTQTSRRDFSFCARLPEVWSTLLLPWIVPCHHFTTAVTEGDGSVRVLGHHGSKQPTSNSEPTLRNRAGRGWVS